MGPRSAGLALAIALSLALSPAAARAETPDPATSQGATEVTVDLSALSDGAATTGGPLAQTYDLQPLGAVALGAAGVLAGGVGHMLRRRLA